MKGEKHTRFINPAVCDNDNRYHLYCSAGKLFYWREQMKVNRINVEISRLANKHRPYLYNEMFSLAKEHQIQGTFGNDYINLNSMPESLLKVLEELKIKFRRIK